MAVYKPLDAFNFVQAYIKYMPLNDVNVQAPLLDMAAKFLWMAAPWRWTLNTWAIGPLAVGTPTTTVTVPADLLYLQQAYIWDGAKETDLSIVPHLSDAPGAAQGFPSQIAVRDGSTVIVSAFPPLNTPPPAVVSVYKQVHPTITAANMSTVGQGLPPDEWFWVYVEAVLYYAYRYGDYDRAGSGQTGPNGPQYTGQLGVLMAAISDMKSVEPLPQRSLSKGVQ